jgi:hypothetical protein
MTIENINPEHIKDALHLLQNKIKGESIIYPIAKGKYQIKMGVTKTKLINYSVAFILIGTLISGIVWLMK